MAGQTFNAIFMGEREGENNRKIAASEEKRKSAAGAASLSSRQHKLAYRMSTPANERKTEKERRKETCFVARTNASFCSPSDQSSFRC